MPDGAIPRFAPSQTIGGVIPVLDVARYLAGDTDALQRWGASCATLSRRSDSTTCAATACRRR